jgi:hypothetical protein
MTLPALYKYLDAQGAKLTLQNRCFKHAKPSTFNDIEDLTIRSIFPEDDETALQILKNGFVDVLVANIDNRPTCHSERLQATITQFLRYLKRNPQLAEALRQQVAAGKLDAVFNVEEMRQRNSNFVAEINRFMQDWRILCVSSLNDFEKMWTRYAEDHQGIVLRILPNVAKDSKYQLFRPVTYRENRPSLYESAAKFHESSLFGDHDARTKESMNTIIYSKTLEWEYENEHRLAIPLGHGEKDWNTLLYHPEEISEIYLGAKETDELRTELIGLAQSVNPAIKIFDMALDAEGHPTAHLCQA